MSRLDRETKKILQRLEIRPKYNGKARVTPGLDTGSLITLEGLSMQHKKSPSTAESAISEDTKSVLVHLQSPKKKKKAKSQDVLSLETKMALKLLEKKTEKSPSTAESAISEDTKSVLVHLQSPKKTKSFPKQTVALTSETELVLSNIQVPAKKAKTKKKKVLTGETEQFLANMKVPSHLQDSLLNDIIYNIKVGVSYDDISKLMVDNNISWSDIKNFDHDFHHTVSQLYMYGNETVMDALSNDVENVLSMDILTVLMKSKTNIDSLLYSACIQKVIPGLLTSNDLGNHFAAVLSLVQRSNFPEILLILTKRIPYLEKEARTKFLKGYDYSKETFENLTVDHFKNHLKSCSVNDLPGYLAGIRELRFEKEQLMAIAEKDQIQGTGGCFEAVQNLDDVDVYEKNTMICECLYHSAFERDIVPEGPMSGYNCLNPQEIQKEVIQMNLKIETMKLEVEKMERWWRTVMHRPINFEEEKGDTIPLDPPVPSPSEPDSEPFDPTGSLLFVADETAAKANNLYFDSQYLDVRLRICSTYYNLSDCALDIKIVQDLSSRADNYNDILILFKTLSTEKMARSMKRKKRDATIKRQESNAVTLAIVENTGAISVASLQNTEVIASSNEAIAANTAAIITAGNFVAKTTGELRLAVEKAEKEAKDAVQEAKDAVREAKDAVREAKGVN